jgi:NADPH-dependent 2,4-dienoyl-CoA reductase/sulfur reductase-like enzyme
VRELPARVGSASGIYYLPTIADVEALRQALNTAQNIVVVGAGFLRLEFAAIAAAAGKQVSLIEASRNIMSHALSPGVAQAFRKHREANGVRFLFSKSVSELQMESAQVFSVLTAAGILLAADIVVARIGVKPNVGTENRGCKNGRGHRFNTFYGNQSRQFTLTPRAACIDRKKTGMCETRYKPLTALAIRTRRIDRTWAIL